MCQCRGTQVSQRNMPTASSGSNWREIMWSGYRGMWHWRCWLRSTGGPWNLGQHGSLKQQSKNEIKKLCSLFNYPASYSGKSVQWLDDREQMWMERPANCLMYYPSACLVGLRKPRKRWLRTVCTPPKFQNGTTEYKPDLLPLQTTYYTLCLVFLFRIC